MQIYLLRHAIAEEPKPGVPDADRALTGEGVRKLRDILKRARVGGLSPGQILTSPFRRARETAELAAKALDFAEPLLTTNALVPSSVAQETWDEIRLYKAETALLLVGHEPAMSHLTGCLLAVPELQIDFKKGAMVRIDVPSLGPRPRGVLKWMLAPRLAG
ncbi:MAG: SixA phosphatase family protein [Acidobacteriota bacterium]